MFLHIHFPEFPASCLIESITYFHDYEAPHPVERLLPDGYVDFIINLSETPQSIYDNESLQQKASFKRGWISGARKGFITIDAGVSNHSLMVIRIKRGAAYNFLRIPMELFTDRVLEADLILGSSFNLFRDDLLSADSAFEKIKLAEEYLLAVSKANLEVPPVVDYFICQIAKAPAQYRMEEIAQKSGYSQKHFISLFKKYAGMTPKEYMRICRFQRTLGEIERIGSLDWTRLALECGYYDQAHFIKDFRLFSGLNPAKYLIEKGETLNYIPVYT